MSQQPSPEEIKSAQERLAELSHLADGQSNLLNVYVDQVSRIGGQIAHEIGGTATNADKQMIGSMQATVSGLRAARDYLSRVTSDCATLTQELSTMSKAHR